MSDILSRVCTAVGESYICKSVSRDECSVDPTGLPDQRVVVDADLALPAHQWSGSRCDFIIFFTEVHRDHVVVTVPLELKSGRAEIPHVSEQLQQGADFAAHFAPSSAICQPILIHGKRINLRELNRAKVLFRDRRMTIRTARCNRAGNLAQALSQE